MRLLIVLAACLALSAAVSHLAPQVIHTRIAYPKQWELVSAANKMQKMTFTVALKQRNLEVLDKLFWAVSDPKSSMYSEFMSVDEILDLVAPDQKDHDAVVAWLVENGVAKSSIVSTRDALKVTTTVKVAAKLFRTRFHNFVNAKGKMIVRQMGSYSMPKDILALVDMVTGVSDFPMPRPSPFKKVGAANDANVVPETLSALYNIPAGTKVTNPLSSAGVAEFQDDNSFLWTDMATFYQQTDITTKNITNIHGPFSTSADTEATLDIEYLTAVGIDATYWYWTETNWMYDFANNLFNAKSVPYVLSMSWGWSEIAQCSIDQDCSTLGINAQTYVTRVNAEFAKIGLRGVSLIASSGDSGANGRTDEYCQDSALHPVFPAASPYVTSVGATQLSNIKTALKNPPPVCSSQVCASGGTEVSVSYDVAGFTSGGGFSVYATQPSYQTEAVSNYLNTSTKLPPASYFNAKGRAYPDVAADGHNYLIYMDGQWMPVGGTSASSPCFAGIISLLNSIKITKSGKPFGPLNTFLYQMAKEHPAAFNDVTSGDNICTESGCASSCKGYTAQAGWDPVSGLGSANYVEMVNYLNTIL